MRPKVWVFAPLKTTKDADASMTRGQNIAYFHIPMLNLSVSVFTRFVQGCRARSLKMIEMIGMNYDRCTKHGRVKVTSPRPMHF